MPDLTADRDPIEVAADDAGAIMVRRVNGWAEPALSHLACGMGDYTPDKRHAKVAMLAIAHAAVEAYEQAHRIKLLRGLGPNIAAEVEREQGSGG